MLGALKREAFIAGTWLYAAKNRNARQRQRNWGRAWAAFGAFQTSSMTDAVAVLHRRIRLKLAGDTAKLFEIE